MASGTESVSASTISTAATAAVSQANTQNQRQDTGQPGQRTGGYRGRNPRHGATTGQANTNNTRTDTRATFKGETEAMNGHVIQCSEERRDPVQYTKTMEALHAYAKRELNTTDLGGLFGSQITKPTIPRPADLAAGASELDTLIQKEEIKQYVTRTAALKGHMVAVHSVAWGQCSEALRAKIKSLTDYTTRNESHDCVWLFTKIQSVMQKFEETRHAFTSMVIVMNSLASCRQGPDQLVSDYVDRIRTIAETIEHHGGSIGDIFLSAIPSAAASGADNPHDDSSQQPDDNRRQLS